MKKIAINVELTKPVKRLQTTTTSLKTIESEQVDKSFRIKEIREGKYELGYYLHVANSRSGHNFVKSNIWSWTNQKEKRPRRNYNLENYEPKQFTIDIKGSNLWKYPDSIIVVQVRDLLNWYASIVLFVKV